MIEAVMLWNEPNNKSHWDFSIDPGWQIFGKMVCAASQSIRAEAPQLPKVLGGISPIDPEFIRNMGQLGVLDSVDVVAVHGFPLDWNHWDISEWPAKLELIRSVTSLPVWVSEVGASSFGAEEVQEFGLTRTAQLLIGQAPRIHWYSLYDLPAAWPAPQHVIGKRKAPPTIATFIWGCCAKTVHPSEPSRILQSTLPILVSANGSILAITGWIVPSTGSRSLAFGMCAQV
jgi:hypothetical protein